jgi:hypothetical protein
MKRLSKVKIEWSPAFAYAIGLLATDGNLSPDGRHLNLTTKDEDLVMQFKKCLNLTNKIGRKSRGANLADKKYYVIQFGDKNFYEYLVSIGITPAKSKTLNKLDIPQKYFIDFFRGCVDGDGSITTHMHPESKHPQLRIRLYSASRLFLEWAKGMVSETTGIHNGWIETKIDGMSVLVYAMKDSISLFSFLYYPGVEYYLKRKYTRAVPFMKE